MYNVVCIFLLISRFIINISSNTYKKMQVLLLSILKINYYYFIITPFLSLKKGDCLGLTLWTITGKELHKNRFRFSMTCFFAIEYWFCLIWNSFFLSMLIIQFFLKISLMVMLIQKFTEVLSQFMVYILVLSVSVIKLSFTLFFFIKCWEIAIYIQMELCRLNMTWKVWQHLLRNLCFS